MKTSELTRAALDWAVAKCEGYEIVRMKGNEITFLDRTEDGALGEKHISYSTNWAQGGPIIEREMVCLIPPRAGIELWEAYHPDFPQEEHYGPTPLIAAMRCYVVSVLGDEIELPTELGESK